jgi:hypothetical protein
MNFDNLIDWFFMISFFSLPGEIFAQNWFPNSAKLYLELDSIRLRYFHTNRDKIPVEIRDDAKNFHASFNRETSNQF